MIKQPTYKLRQIYATNGETTHGKRNGKPLVKDSQIVYLYFRPVRGLKDGLLIYPTPYRIAPRFWNFSNKRVSTNNETANAGIDANKINNNLDLIQRKAIEVAERMVLEGIPIDFEVIRNELEVLTGRSTMVNDEKPEFMDYLKLHSLQPEEAKGTAAGFLNVVYMVEAATLHKILVEFIQDKRVKTIAFDDLNDTWLRAFLEFAGVNRPWKASYKRHLTSKLKQLLGNGVAKNLHTNNAHKGWRLSRLFKIPKAKNVFCTPNEIERILDCEITHSPNGKLLRSDVRRECLRARETFAVSLVTGFRSSDMEEITTDSVIDIGGKRYVALVVKKTQAIIKVPCNWVVDEVLDRNNGRVPSYKESTSVNSYLKLVCYNAKVLEEVDAILTIKGKEVFTTVPKYERVTTHTGRRSFCTNLHNSGESFESIMIVSGHKTVEMVRRYVIQDEEKEVQSLADRNELFSQSRPLKAV